MTTKRDARDVLADLIVHWVDPSNDPRRPYDYADRILLTLAQAGFDVVPTKGYL